jgi:hypothetical protein
MSEEQPKRHHWWPECVSERWADAEGGVNCLLPSGEARRARPAAFGVIGNGHSIKLGGPGEPTPWDINFESEFQKADDSFPGLISWLDGLDRAEPPFEIERAQRILPQQVDDERLDTLIECIVSLAVRSPMYRERAVALAEDLRGPLPERERNALIAANMQRSQRSVVRSIRGGGKVMVLYSPERELVFGDGFFHNIYPPGEHIYNAKILAPITPWMSVLFVRPSSYRIDPRLVTMTLSIEEADALNYAVQVYAKEQLFYRTQRPAITPAYKGAAHFVFKDDRNPVDDLIYSMPGIPPRDTALDFLNVLED